MALARGLLALRMRGGRQPGLWAASPRVPDRSRSLAVTLAGAQLHSSTHLHQTSEALAAVSTEWLGLNVKKRKEKKKDSLPNHTS